MRGREQEQFSAFPQRKKFDVYVNSGFRVCVWRTANFAGPLTHSHLCIHAHIHMYVYGHSIAYSVYVGCLSALK